MKAPKRVSGTCKWSVNVAFFAWDPLTKCTDLASKAKCLRVFSVDLNSLE